VKKRKTFIAAAALLAALLITCRNEVEIDLPVGVVLEYRGFEFVVNHGIIRIVGYNGSGTDITIPSSIHGRPVTDIYSNAFRNRGLTSVVIGDNIWHIGAWAFYNNKLTKIVIPDNIVFGWPGISVGNWAFANNQLAKAELGRFTRFTAGAFQNNLLTKVVIPEDVISISHWTFENNRLADVVIHDNVRYIGTRAFANNELTKIRIPDSVTDIAAYAFVDNDIVKITIGEGVVLRVRDGETVFPRGFDDFYREHGSRAGVYTFDGYRWNAEFK